MKRHGRIGLALIFCVTAQLPAAELELADGEARIFLANPDGSEMKRLTDLPPYAVQGSPAWSGDAKQIAFDAHQAGENNTQTKIIVVNADGTNPRVLTDGAMPSFSPGGNRIAFSRYGPNRGVWVMSAEGPEKELVLLDEEGWSADWSPDGSRIVYSKRTGKGDNFVVFNLIEGTTTTLFKQSEEPYSSLFWNFGWSPDGQQIVFRASKNDGAVEVGMVDARGAEHGLKTLVAENMNRITSNFAWAPDSSAVLLTIACPEREKRTQIYSLPLAKLELELLPKQQPDYMHAGIALSPDGKRLAISTRKPAAKK